MKGLDSLPSWAILTVILLVTSSLNEVVSNATTASILLPVLKDISIQLGLNPLYLMLPVVLSCNYTFMLPASCPPNAIVYKVSLCYQFMLVKVISRGKLHENLPHGTDWVWGKTDNFGSEFGGSQHIRRPPAGHGPVS